MLLSRKTGDKMLRFIIVYKKVKKEKHLKSFQCHLLSVTIEVNGHCDKLLWLV